jgi:hypothetical protein
MLRMAETLEKKAQHLCGSKNNLLAYLSLIEMILFFEKECYFLFGDYLFEVIWSLLSFQGYASFRGFFL